VRKSVNKDLKLNDTVRVVAHIHGVSPRTVQMVRNGDRNNENITESLIAFEQGVSYLIQQLVKKVPITPNPEKYAR
jgi:hypothetical protein